MAIHGPVGQHSFYDGRQEFERGLLPPTFRGGTFQLFPVATVVNNHGICWKTAGWMMGRFPTRQSLPPVPTETMRSGYSTSSQLISKLAQPGPLSIVCLTAPHKTPTGKHMSCLEQRRPAGADISTSPDLITELLASTPNNPHFLLDYMHELDAISIETGPIPRILLYCVQTSPGSVRRFLYGPTDPDLELPLTRHRVLPRTFIQVPGKLNLTGCDPFRISCQIT